MMEKTARASRMALMGLEIRIKGSPRERGKGLLHKFTRLLLANLKG
jgi:hypothetical protein